MPNSVLRITFILLAAGFGLLVPLRSAPAQNCGSPPDPRTNTAGYASWCSCMGGSYNYQTTACVGARSPQVRRRGSSSSGGWYCIARARNGANGWARHYRTEAEARRRALAECHNYSKGQACAIRSCRLEGSGAAQTRRPSPAQTRQGRRTRPAYGCDVCHRKLMSDLRAGWASARTRTYVDQAIAGYENCKRKAAGSCLQGDILARTVRNACFGFRTEASFRACLGRTLGP